MNETNDDSVRAGMTRCLDELHDFIETTVRRRTGRTARP